MARISAEAGSKLPFDFLYGISLDGVAIPDVVKTRYLDSALEALADFFHVVLETTQGSDLAIVLLNVVGEDPHQGVAIDLAFEDHATGDGADLRDGEGLE